MLQLRAPWRHPCCKRGTRARRTVCGARNNVCARKTGRKEARHSASAASEARSTVHLAQPDVDLGVLLALPAWPELQAKAGPTPPAIAWYLQRLAP